MPWSERRKSRIVGSLIAYSAGKSDVASLEPPQRSATNPWEVGIEGRLALKAPLYPDASLPPAEKDFLCAHRKKLAQSEYPPNYPDGGSQLGGICTRFAAGPTDA